MSSKYCSVDTFADKPAFDPPPSISDLEFSCKLIFKMFETIYSLPFLVLEVPNLKIKQPTWFHQPSAMTIFSLVLLSYFLVTGGMY